MVKADPSAGVQVRPTGLFVLCPLLPLKGDIRLTEQGETIERKYANIGNAAYNLELLIASTACSSVRERQSKLGLPTREKRSWTTWWTKA